MVGSNLPPLKEVSKELIKPETFFGIVSFRLQSLGFTKGKTIAGAVTCRDELCFPLIEIIKDHWDNPFILSGLAGIPLSGRTALRAMISHAPNMDSTERYIFFVFSHIGLDDGMEGACKRPGRGEIGSACGALLVILKELEEGRLNLLLDPLDWEQSLLKLKLLREIPFGHRPSLWELTQIALSVAVRDLLTILSELINPSKVSYAVISGIHIHMNDGNFIYPGKCFAVVQGEQFDLDISNFS